MFKDRIIDIDKIKNEIDQYNLLSAHLLSMLKQYFRIGLTYSSNALEGNTLTETETKVILEDGLTIGGKTMREHFEVVGHSQAYDFMWSKAQGERFAEDDIRKLHHLFYYRIDEGNAGNHRKIPIFVSGTDFEFPKPSELSFLMHDFAQELPQLKQQYHPVHFLQLWYTYV